MGYRLTLYAIREEKSTRYDTTLYTMIILSFVLSNDKDYKHFAINLGTCKAMSLKVVNLIKSN